MAIAHAIDNYTPMAYNLIGDKRWRLSKHRSLPKEYLVFFPIMNIVKYNGR